MSLILVSLLKTMMLTTSCNEYMIVSAIYIMTGLSNISRWSL